jgi:hypothetical protein|tara:strand:- start:1108 stop:1509 length:402 start_codon:yes stop_codon:yes gene_type:complete
MTEAVERSVAEADVERWLSAKRVRASKRKDAEDQIEALIEAVVWGQMIVNEDDQLVQTLDFPIEAEIRTTNLTYKNRVSVSEMNSKLKGVKSGDVDDRVLRVISAITGKPAGVIGRLDTSDYSVAQSVAIFFL